MVKASTVLKLSYQLNIGNMSIWYLVHLSDEFTFKLQTIRNFFCGKLELQMKYLSFFLVTATYC
jgi:hypothetical protein